MKGGWARLFTMDTKLQTWVIQFHWNLIYYIHVSLKYSVFDLLLNSHKFYLGKCSLTLATFDGPLGRPSPLGIWVPNRVGPYHPLICSDFDASILKCSWVTPVHLVLFAESVSFATCMSWNANCSWSADDSPFWAPKCPMYCPENRKIKLILSTQAGTWVLCLGISLNYTQNADGANFHYASGALLIWHYAYDQLSLAGQLSCQHCLDTGHWMYACKHNQYLQIEKCISTWNGLDVR